MHRSRHGASEIPDDAAAYAASLAVLTTMEMASNAISARLSLQYQKEDVDCSATAITNQQRYETLQENPEP